MIGAAGEAGILRRLASMVYEALLLAAVWFMAAFLVVPLASSQDALTRTALRIYLLAVAAAYFVWFWSHGGQTLAMKTWGLRLETVQGERLSAARALLRFLLAVPGVLLAFGILWAFMDRDRRFLHDRVAGTRIVDTT